MGSDDSKPTAERRRDQRWEMGLACRIESADRWFNARIMDLSEVGAFIESSLSPDPEQPITVSVLAEEGEVQIQGVVKHAGLYALRFTDVSGFGLAFVDPPIEVIRRLTARHHLRMPEPGDKTAKLRIGPSRLLDRLMEINKEIWLIVSLILISILANFVVASNEMVLSFYIIPTVFSAYFYGRRHATLTALASVLLVVLMVLFGEPFGMPALRSSRWVNITVWGGTLIVIGYAIGSLYEHVKARMQDLRQTYNGVLIILQHFVAQDKYTENHSYRVSVYATKMAREMRLDEDRIEDVRAAALLHDIGKMEISRQILYKAASLEKHEYDQMKLHVEKGAGLLAPVGGSLRRVIPIVLAHHDTFDGSGYHPFGGESIPLEARIIAVADVYDAVTSDRPYRKAMPVLDAREMIEKASGTEFDPQVVKVFMTLSRRGELEVPEIIV
ncbi:MAG: HD domain-containing phosphohydrolase [Acidobacteriota bacterium]